MKRRVVILVAFVVVAGLAVAIFASFHAPNHYQSFRRQCLSKAGDTVVVLSQTSHNVAMGAAIKEYNMGCRAPDGTIGARMTTNNP
jgi:Flp pilus assembly protein CpaB